MPDPAPARPYAAVAASSAMSAGFHSATPTTDPASGKAARSASVSRLTRKRALIE